MSDQNLGRNDRELDLRDAVGDDGDEDEAAAKPLALTSLRPLGSIAENDKAASKPAGDFLDCTDLYAFADPPPPGARGRPGGARQRPEQPSVAPAAPADEWAAKPGNKPTPPPPTDAPAPARPADGPTPPPPTDTVELPKPTDKQVRQYLETGENGLRVARIVDHIVSGRIISDLPGSDASPGRSAVLETFRQAVKEGPEAVAILQKAIQDALKASGSDATFKAIYGVRPFDNSAEGKGTVPYGEFSVTRGKNRDGSPNIDRTSKLEGDPTRTRDPQPIRPPRGGRR